MSPPAASTVVPGSLAPGGLVVQTPSSPNPGVVGGQHGRGGLVTSSRDAVGALKAMALEPVSGLPAVYAELGERATGAGVALCCMFAVSSAIGLNLAMQRLSGLLGAFVGRLGGASFVKLTILALIVAAALAVACLGLRKVLGALPGFGADAFTAGASLAPLGIAILVSGFIGVANGEVIAVLLLCAMSYLILMLHAGLTRVGGLRDRAAAPAVPIVLIVAAWLSKVVALALLV